MGEPELSKQFTGSGQYSVMAERITSSRSHRPKASRRYRRLAAKIIEDQIGNLRYSSPRSTNLPRSWTPHIGDRSQNQILDVLEHASDSSSSNDASRGPEDIDAKVVMMVPLDTLRTHSLETDDIPLAEDYMPDAR